MYLISWSGNILLLLNKLSVARLISYQLMVVTKDVFLLKQSKVVTIMLVNNGYY